MPGYIEDRWWTKKPDPATGKKRKTARYGQGKRYRVAGIPGVRDRSFEKLGGPEGALAWLANAQTDAARGTFYDPRDGSMTLGQYVTDYYWPTLRRTPTTKEAMERRVFRHILPFAGALPLNRIGSDEILAWQAWAEKRIDVSTLRVTWRHFSSIMQAAYKAKRIPVNPFRDEDLRAPAAPKSKALAWSRSTVASVQENLGRRYQILSEAAVSSGLRQGEAFALSPDDVDGEDLRVVRQVVKTDRGLAFAPPKGNKERVAPCTAQFAEAAKRHMKEFPPIEVTLPWLDPARPNMAWEDRPLRTVRLLVTTARGGALNRSTFDEKQWKPALVAAEVIDPPEVDVVERNGQPPLKRVRFGMPREHGFHVLRHTFASVVLAGGESVTKLAEWLGHSDPAFTLRTYVHFMPRAGARGVAALEAWLSSEDGGDL
ncbi:tyrosine-type recombinase/integrase [Streptomyces albus]|uniref:tyrosine-type recombinase/integrase n=1 Tax=Streptomyces TaxID=1883 RepID=UPI0004BF0D93|nr:MULTISPECIES: site-specific integrase [Streptomyces]GHJ21691.1 hypothetical protein TPA0909_33050 [Streptomyces albus]